MTVISEVGIYEAVFGSELKEAKDFKSGLSKSLNDSAKHLVSKVSKYSAC